MKFIQRFIRAWKDATLKQAYYGAADDPEYWTQADIMWLAGMLSQPSGQKWMRRMNNMVIRKAIDATKCESNPRYLCGVATGMRLLKEFIDGDYIAALSLARAQTGKTETTEAERDADDLDTLLSQIT